MRYRFIITFGWIVFILFGHLCTQDSVAFAADKVLNLSDVLSRVEQHNPKLAVSKGRVREAEARVDQATALPNPELTAEFENFAGSSEFGGSDLAETTVALSQSLPMGGKLGDRRRAAEFDVDLQMWSHHEARARLMYSATMAFVDVLSAEQLAELADRAVDLANAARQNVRRRVEAGSISKVELTRADIAAAQVRLERERHRRDLDRARSQLASL